MKAMQQEKLRILRVASDVYPDKMGGLGVHVHEMSKLQADWGHDVTVLTSNHGKSETSYQEKRSGYQLIRHKEIASPIDNSIYPGLLRSLRDIADDYDVIHAHSHLFFSTNLTAFYRNFNDTPLIITNHGLISQTAPKWLQKIFIPTIARFTLESADEVLCYTATDKQRLRERGIESDITIINNGIDCDQFSPTPESKTGKDILFVGRLKPGKGVNDLLIAFKEVLSEHPDSRLKIVGDGPLCSDLIQQSKDLAIFTEVDFMGQIENDRMPEVYSQCDLFALPSMNEGLPRTVLEAMACELPVVVSDLEQLGPVVEGAGITVPREDPPALASALEELLSDSKRREQMGAIGRERVENEYSWTETVRKTIEVYHQHT